MAEIIEARVIQKIDTEANWMINPLIILKGEQAFVSDKNNFKIGDGNKTFAQLEYYYKGDVVGTVTTTEDLSLKSNGVYYAQTSGTYSGVVVKEGYYTLLRKNGNVWSIATEVKVPNYNATEINEKIKQINDNLTVFSKDQVNINNGISFIKNITVEQLTNIKVDLYMTRLTYIASTGVFQVIINLNGNTTNNLPIQSYVFNGNVNTNKFVTASNEVANVTIFIDDLYTQNIGIDVQQSPIQNWYKVKKYNTVLTDNSYSPFKAYNDYITNYPTSIRIEHLQAFRSIDINYNYDFDAYNYIIGLLRKGYTGDGVGKENQIFLYRQPKNDVGTNSNLVTIATYVGAFNNGVQDVVLNPYNPNVIGRFNFKIDWSILPSVFNSNYQGNGIFLSPKAFNAIDKYYSISELINKKPERAVVGGAIFQRKTNVVSSIKDYTISSEYKNINKKSALLDSINIAGYRFSCVGNDDKIYFYKDKTAYYCNNIEEIKEGNYTLIKEFEEDLSLIRTLNNGELIVATKGEFETNKIVQIHVSSNNRTVWSRKTDFNNANNGTRYINQWGFSQYGDMIVLSGYGKRYTSDEASTEAPKYADINQKANYSIYFSYDNGNTWVNNLFNLGSYYASNLQPYAHIHAVHIDPYWNELVISYGDLGTGLNGIYRTTNLLRWIDARISGVPIAINWVNDKGFKFGGLGSSENNLLFGSDDVPNGVYRAVRTDYNKTIGELSYTENKWSYQRALRNPDGSPNTSSEYGVWGGFQFKNKGNNPIVATNVYISGVHVDDYKKNQLVVSNDGFNWFKVWESKHDLVTSNNVVLPNYNLHFDYFNDVILLQENNGQYNMDSNNKPTLTDNLTLHIVKL